MIKIEYSESGGKVERFLQSVESGKEVDSLAINLAKDLKEFRVCKPAKLGVKIEQIKEDD